LADVLIEIVVTLIAMKQLLLLVAVYALILNQTNKHFFKTAKPEAPSPALTKSVKPYPVYPPHMSMAAMITRLAALTIPKAQQ
jgi:hypothetical protein